jgi:phosphatidylglycerophosphate synthase
MFDAALRRLIDPPLNQVARAIARSGVSADILTIAGAAIGLVAAVAISREQFGAGLVLIMLNRIFDGFDGAVARINGTTEFGGYLDTLADFLFYVSVPVAFGWANGANQLPALLLVASFTLTAVSFLGFAAIAAKRGESDGVHGPKALIYSTGLMEGGETIAFFILFCLFPAYFPGLAMLFAGLCILTGIFVRFCPCRVGVDGCQDFAQAHIMLHGKGNLCQNLSRMLADDGGAQYLVAAFRGQDFDKAACLALGNRAVEIIEIIARHVE